MKLPRNVALVRFEVNGRHYVFVSDRLNHDQELAARVAAALLATTQPYVLLTCADVMAALHAARAVAA